MADTSAWDAEMAALLVCPDCRGPAAVHSSIEGTTRRIKIWQWHERTCPAHRIHLGWTDAHALDAQLFAGEPLLT